MFEEVEQGRPQRLPRKPPRRPNNNHLHGNSIACCDLCGGDGGQRSEEDSTHDKIEMLALSLVLLWVAVQASPSRIRRPLDGAIPPQEPPPDLVELFTMNGKIPLKVNQATYVREDFNATGFREEFSHLNIDRKIKSMKSAGGACFSHWVPIA